MPGRNGSLATTEALPAVRASSTPDSADTPPARANRPSPLDW
ncbi:hypothetical protein ACW9HR_24320 [Nocardia gipuzkoensis]